MVAVRKQIVAGNARRVGSGTNTRRSITIHETGNTSRGANARAHANLQSNGNSRAASWHYTVDDKEVVQSYENTARCFHSGKAVGNNTSVSIEICVNSDGNYNAAVQKAAELTAQLLKELGLGLGDVRQHHSWSGKNCPTRLRAGSAGGWQGFLNRVSQALNGHVAPTPSPAPQPAPKPQPAPSNGQVWNGSNEADTRSMQQVLKGLGYYKGAVDGVYGPMTKAACLAYQNNQKYAPGLIKDGLWGQQTYKHYAWTRELQRRINLWKETLNQLTVDGDYGADTVAKLTRLQRKNGLYPDGIAGPITCDKLGMSNHPGL